MNFYLLAGSWKERLKNINEVRSSLISSIAKTPVLLKRYFVYRESDQLSQAQEWKKYQQCWHLVMFFFYFSVSKKIFSKGIKFYKLITIIQLQLDSGEQFWLYCNTSVSFLNMSLHVVFLELEPALVLLSLNTRSIKDQHFRGTEHRTCRGKKNSF